MVFTHPVDVRYLEADQQGVVFHMWYLAYFEDARNAFFAATGHSLDDLLASGHDIQLVHTEIHWTGAVRWPARVEVAVGVTKVGRTSLTLDFEVRDDGASRATGRTVYVIVTADGFAKAPIPEPMRRALDRFPPLRKDEEEAR